MVILSKFAENLSALMQEHNINAPKLGKILNINRSNITRYLRGERLPSYRLFIAIIEYFNVSADVLLGRIDYCETQAFQPTKPFGGILQNTLKEARVTQTQLQKDLHLSSATTYTWLTNQRIPSVEHLDELADYLEVSVDYLLGRIL
jgi:transcriptional regulator with XRE-family HTH domain